MFASLFCFLCKCKCSRSSCCCNGRQHRDPRGEYRAVGRMLAHNFDTDLSDEDDDDMNFYSDEYDNNGGGYDGNGNGHRSHTDTGWSNHDNKGAIELGSIGADRLTLEEMNG